jgi:hypothetical protein
LEARDTRVSFSDGPVTVEAGVEISVTVIENRSAALTVNRSVAGSCPAQGANTIPFFFCVYKGLRPS